MSTATPQDLAARFIEESGPPPEDFKASIQKDGEIMKSFVRTIRNGLTDEGFKSRYVMCTGNIIYIDSVNRWAEEVARIILGNEPSPNFSTD